jgi:non-ribosomal peptide synthetase component F
VEYNYEKARERIGGYIKYFNENQIVAGDLVCIEGEKEFETYCLMLACYIFGVTYIPFTQNLNLERIKSSIYELKVKLSFTINEETDKFFAGNSLPYCNFKTIKNEKFDIKVQEISEDNLAYVMFSSGTTGVPKAIPVTRKNLSAYIDSIDSEFPIESKCCFSQVAELTFDLSIHDIYLCYSTGGYLCPIKANEAILAYRFINQLNINYWMSVPSTASYMFQMVPNVKEMHSLKCTFFLGEALTSDVALKWAQLSPNGVTINLYGPTECTVAASFYKIDSQDELLKTQKIVPIGRALKNAALQTLDEGEAELFLSGEQLFPGYIGSSEVNNKDKLIVKNQTTLYKTGDLVHCEDGLYFFKGRTDFQVKIRGYRIELEDLEATLMRELTGDFCVMASNELQLGNYESAAVLFSGGSSLDDVRHVVERSFPKYIPISNVKKVSKVPRNINGKLDRKAVKGMMSE